MTSNKDKNIELRKRAENVIGEQFDLVNDQFEDPKYIHELRVHQIELEMQNEELLEAQIKLEDARSKYFDLYNFAPVGYFTLNENELIINVNIAGATLLGTERFNLNKRSFIQFIAIDQRNKFHKHLSKVLQSNEKQSVELKLLKVDGSPFYAILETVNTCKNGVLNEFRINLTDITNLKNKEKILKRQTTLLNLSNEAIFSWEFDKGIISWNHGAESLYGYSTRESIGKNSNELLKTEFPIEFNQIKEKLFNHKIWIGEVLHTTKDGKKIIVESHQQLIRGDDRDIVIEANRNITKRIEMEKLMKQRTQRIENINKILNIEIGDYEKAETELMGIIEKYKISNKELEQFAYITSHDLKEPLRMITSFLQLLQRRYSEDLDENANEFIDFAVEGAKRLDMMINDLLEYSQIRNLEVEFEYLNSAEILETVLRDLNPSIEDNKAIITHDSLPTIYANRQMMNQLFENIIGNAIKYHGKDQPKIHISAIKSDNEYIFSVKDNGIGMEQRHLKRIFTIFQRLNSREEYDGTGIGLAISEKIIQKHKGKIWVESELGKGTTFFFTIPVKT